MVGFLVLAGSLTIVGIIGNLFVFDAELGTAEADLVEWTAEHRVGPLDTVATVASSLSDTWTVIGVVVGAMSMLWASGRARLAATVGLAITLEFATFIVVGTIVGRTRPDVEPLHSVPSTSSYPSGHVAAAFVIYGSLVLVARVATVNRLPRLVWVAPYAIAFLVAWSRVYEGVHHPTDVAAGLLLGMGALVAAGLATGTIDAHSPERSGASQPLGYDLTG
jgi:membrane-associated phospholipid phosphatase